MKMRLKLSKKCKKYISYWIYDYHFLSSGISFVNSKIFFISVMLHLTIILESIDSNSYYIRFPLWLRFLCSLGQAPTSLRTHEWVPLGLEEPRKTGPFSSESTKEQVDLKVARIRCQAL